MATKWIENTTNTIGYIAVEDTELELSYRVRGSDDDFEVISDDFTYKGYRLHEIRVKFSKGTYDIRITDKTKPDVKTITLEVLSADEGMHKILDDYPNKDNWTTTINDKITDLSEAIKNIPVETLTEEEHDQLMKLNDAIETADAMFNKVIS